MVQISTSTTENGCPSTVPANEKQEPKTSDTMVLINTALLAQLEALEAANFQLKSDLDKLKNKRNVFNWNR